MLVDIICSFIFFLCTMFWLTCPFDLSFIFLGIQGRQRIGKPVGLRGYCTGWKMRGTCLLLHVGR